MARLKLRPFEIFFAVFECWKVAVLEDDGAVAVAQNKVRDCDYECGDEHVAETLLDPPFGGEGECG